MRKTRQPEGLHDYLGKDSDDWMGWRKVYEAGYADFFEFWDNGDDGVQPSVLKRTFEIDAIAMEKQTFCFRPDGSLALVYSEMTSPNMANGSTGAAITRQGRIYVSTKGKILQVLGKVVGDGIEAALGDPSYQLARGCWELDLHLRLDSVRAKYLSEMGDLGGSKPTYQPNLYDWCSVAK